MSTDMRNSILLWVAALALAGVFWASLQFDLLEAFPSELVWLVVGVGIGTNIVAPLIRTIWNRLQNRSAESR